MNPSPYRVVVAMPVQDSVCAETAFCLANLIATHVAATDDTVIPRYEEGTLLPAQRHALVAVAHKAGATHILFVDADMSFPPNALARLLAAECRVIGANCAKRSIPSGPTAANYVRGQKIPVYSGPDAHGMERVDRVGTGFLLIDMAVFEEVSAPWFETPWVPERLGFMGEDVAFCWKLAEANIPVFIDHDLSKEIGHIGSFDYRHEHIEVTRPLEEERERPLVSLQ